MQAKTEPQVITHRAGRIQHIDTGAAQVLREYLAGRFEDFTVMSSDDHGRGYSMTAGLHAD